jgi:DNA-binding CsgD family transcriptional regulator
MPSAWSDSQPKSVLTPREQEALLLLSRGLLREQIAEEMCITLGSVRNLIQIVRRKLDVETSIQAVVWAWANGLMHEEGVVVGGFVCNHDYSL